MSVISNSTNINDLPTDPVSGGSIDGNINLEISDTNKVVFNPTQTQMSLDQTTISQIVNSLQQASIAGATTLPSRDLPLTTNNLTNDEAIKANYIPKPEKENYILEDNDELENYYKNEKTQSSLDQLYDELQIPLLISILYFLFQLPIFKKIIFKYLPFFCKSDGNYNLNGLMFTCILFGFSYYLLITSLKQFNRF
jgi:hypothetical protein